MTDEANRRRRPAYKRGAVDPARKRWLRTEGVEFVQYERPAGEKEKGEGSQEEWGPTHVIAQAYLKGGNRRVFYLDLTEFTLEELEAVEQFYMAAFSDARDICELRDRLAQEAFDNGDDAYFRIYRQVPQLVERSRKGR